MHVDSGAPTEIKKRKDAPAVTAATKLKKSLRSSSSTATSTPLSTSHVIPGSRKLKKTGNGRASAADQQHIGQPSKLFLMLLNSKATLIQRWWRSLRRNAPSFIPNDKLLTVKEGDPVQDEQSEVVRKRRQAIAEQARLEVLRDLERDNEKMLKERAAHVIVEATNELPVVQIATAAEPADVNKEEIEPSLNSGQNAKESKVDIQPAREEVTFSYTNINAEAANAEQEYLIDYEIQAVNNYYNQNQQDCTAGADDYEEDFEDFEQDEDHVSELAPHSLKEPLINRHVQDEQIAIDETSTNPEDLEDFLEELDKKQYTPDNLVKSLATVPSEQDQTKAAQILSLEKEKKQPVIVLQTAAESAPLQPIITTLSTSLPDTMPSPRAIQSNEHKPIPPISIQTVASHPPDRTDQSVTRILSFLKNVEQQPIQLQTSPQILSQIQGSHQGQNISSNPSIFDDVKQKIMASQLEIRDKSKTIHVLQQELQRLKEAHQNDTLELQKSSRSQLSLQRKEYETIVKRHLSFIDNVLAEKETLSARVVELTDKVTGLEKQFHQKATAMEESHLKNLSQQKELWQTQERIKREKWIQDRTRQIKEQTIQGLEPEIQKLIATQKSALRNTEEEYRTRLQSEKTAMTEAFQVQLDKLREKHVVDRQRACEEEREFARERYCKQLEREEMEFQQQKRKLQLEHEQSRLQWSQSTTTQLQEQEQHFKIQLAKLQEKLDKQKQAHDTHIANLEKQKDNALSDLKSNLETQKEEWQALVLKKTENQVRAREKAFREQVIRERDAEIEVVIDRLERESGSSNSDATRRYRMDIERIKAETANEIKELRDQHSLALDKLLTANTRITTLESEIRDLQKEVLKSSHALLAKESQVKSLKDTVLKLGGDESSVICNLRRDFEDQIDGFKQQIQNLQDSLAKEKEFMKEKQHEFQENMNRLRKEKEETVQVLEKQVRISLASKDTAISTLKSSLQESHQKLTHLEHLMDQQRSELLGL